MTMVICSLPRTRWFCQTLGQAEVFAMDEIDSLMQRAAGLGSSGAVARQSGDESAAEGLFSRAFDVAQEAACRSLSIDGRDTASRLEALQMAACLALDCGNVSEAQHFIDEAIAAAPATGSMEQWAQLRDVTAWPDAWLVAAIRRDPPHEPALDTLAQRYWKRLFGRCRLLTLDHQKANDLAQEAWCRVLRARRTLKPGGNFPGFLTAVATNIWRDWNRSARRAGAMAEDRMASLDAELTDKEGTSVALAEALPDVNTMRAEEQRRLMLDIDDALACLSPILREVIVSRYLAGESCADIGRRHGRTEQTISAWVRQAIRQIRLHLEPVAAPSHAARNEKT